MTAPIVLIGIPVLLVLVLVVALPGVRIAKESGRGVDGGPLRPGHFFNRRKN